jgi:hypothetical protein
MTYCHYAAQNRHPCNTAKVTPDPIRGSQDCKKYNEDKAKCDMRGAMCVWGAPVAKQGVAGAEEIGCYYLSIVWVPIAPNLFRVFQGLNP